MQHQVKKKQTPPSSVTPTGVVANDAETSRFAHLNGRMASVLMSPLYQPPLPTISGTPWLAVNT